MEFFGIVAALAIVTGGTISAFTARRPTRFAMWVTAYLVLIVGVVQAGLLFGWQQLGSPLLGWAATAFVLYNLGNIGVIAGRWLKGKESWARYIVYGGGALLGIAMLILGGLSLTVTFSWVHAILLAFIVIILVSMPIGLWLSARSHKDLHKAGK